MRLKAITLLIALAFSLLVAPLAAGAQQAGKVYRIGFLRTGQPPTAWMEAFQQGIRDLGYVEGQHLVIEYRLGDGQADRLPALAAELVSLRVDCIMAAGTQATQAAKHATTTIPIVMVGSSDAVGTGLVTSLARPGGNITGLSLLHTELSGKRLELLKEAVPGLWRVAVLWQGGPGARLALQETEAAGRVLGVELQALEVRGPNDFEPAFAAATREGAEALLVLPSTFFNTERRRIMELVAKSRLPAMFFAREYAEAGGLIAYGPSIPDLYRRAAYYVHRILQGAKPADLPVEQPMKFEFVINLNTAQQMGLTIPPTLLFRADKVIQ